MKINFNSKIVGELVVLVPYRESHVEKYHEWMASSELQKLTASEPLSLEQEYQMQKSWAADEDKCTFIILDKAKYATTNNEVESMIGDTNLFLTDAEDRTLAEIEIMIAESSFRGSGRGRESTLLMLKYDGLSHMVTHFLNTGIEQLNIKHFQAKIGLDNVASIRMFQKMGFEETSRSNVFNEVTLAVASAQEDLMRYLNDNVIQYNLSSY